MSRSHVLFSSLAIASLSACNAPFASVPLAPPPGAASYADSVHVPTQLGRIEVPSLPSLPSVPGGKTQPLQVACINCHALRAAASLPRDPSELKEFHTGLRFAHGTLDCTYCHVAGAQDRLRLASGETLPMREALTLCSQCHGSQRRDYDHGAHGGMTGYWDRSRGARQRNHCVDCHDPHRPAYVGGMPVAAARDRFSSSQAPSQATDQATKPAEVHP